MIVKGEAKRQGIGLNGSVGCAMLPLGSFSAHWCEESPKTLFRIVSHPIRGTHQE